MQAQSGEGGDAGGGSADAQQTPSVDVQAAIDTAVAGLKAKNSDLIQRLQAAQDNLKRFDGIDPDAVRNILKRFSDDEEAGLIQAGKVDEVLNKRTERMKADYDKKLAAAMQAAEAATQRAQAFQGRVLDDAIRAAAVKAGLHQHAIDDALFRARSMFTLDENGSAVQFDADGSPVLGKDGKTPFTPMEWLEGMKDKAPHWFPATASGSGATSSGGGRPTNGDFGGSKADRLAAIKQMTNA
ncbi:hypothetical protein [Acidovorax sp. MR-S7]|uniref:hypothetical protein n=1 Tax=Acidovorax sp. MR-S7 TaxID=1268622 RepID=UPI000379F53A|nr:hypothetical protein [Acidovorax sp. MR-S7]